LISCRALYAIGAFLGAFTGTAGLVGTLPVNVATGLAAFTAGYVAAVAVYCHSTDHPGEYVSPPS